jgi:hypothetical protein
VDEAFYFCECGHAGVAGGGHGECAVGYAASDGPFDGLASEQAVDEARGEAVAAANAIVDIDVVLGNVNDLVFIECNGAPGVAAGGWRGAQGAGDEFEIGIGIGKLVKHVFISGDGELGEVVTDAGDGDAEHGGKIFFIAEEQVDFADQFAIDFLGLGLATDGFPEGVAEVEVVGDGRAVLAGGVHGFNGDLGGGGGERGEDAAGMEELRSVLGAEDRLPIEVAGLDLADGGVAAIGTARGGADAVTAFSKVEAVADGAADAVVGNPAEEGRIDAALKDEVFNEAADGVVGDGGRDGGVETEAAAESTSDVVFAATFPDLELAGGVDAAFTGIEAQHDFAEAETVPTAGRRGNNDFVHGSNSAFLNTLNQLVGEPQ